VARYRRAAFVMSFGAAGLAGALYASNFAYVSPDMVSFNITTMALTMVILGGAGSVPGVILGAILVIGYDKLFIPAAGCIPAQFNRVARGSVRHRMCAGRVSSTTEWRSI